MTGNHLIIMGVAVVVFCGALIILWRWQYRNVFSVFLVVGIVALAVFVTVQQVEQFRQQHAVAAQVALPAPLAASGSSSRPAAPVIIAPPIGMRGPSGAAAPPAALNPSAGGMR